MLPIEIFAESLGLQFRILNENDLPAATELSTLVDWNQNAEDWRLFVHYGIVFGLFESDSTLAATAAIMPLPPEIAWVSMVIVRPSRRRMGLSTALLNHCMSRIKTECYSSGLDASEEGAVVYPRLGYVVSETIIRMKRPALDQKADLPIETISKPISKDTLFAVTELDLAWSGTDREFLLGNLTNRLPDCARWVADNEGTPLAYIFARPGREATQLGPIGATQPELAIKLVQEVAGQIREPLIIDIPSCHQSFIGHLTDLGWVQTRQFIRMAYPSADTLETLDHFYAIAGPEFS